MRALPWVLGVAFVALVFAQGWVNEDAFIIFRTVDNFHDGFGLRWNTFERVQSYSCASWTLLLTAFDTFVRNPFLSAIVLSLILAAGTAWLAARWCKGEAPWRLAFLIGLLASSKSFIDYSSSGLENPLANFLLAAVLVEYAAFLAASRETEVRHAALLLTASAFLVLTRQDLALIAGPAALHVLIRLGMRRGLTTVAGLCLVCGLPILAWEAFSLLYYGFLVPNTAFAKLAHGAPTSIIREEAYQFFVATVHSDPITVGIVAFGILYAAARSTLADRLVMCGVTAYLVYVWKIGGDWMVGRFFAAPLLAAAFVLSRRVGPRIALACVAVLAVMTVREPLPPLKFWKPYPREAVHLWGVIDPKAGKYGPKEARLLLHGARPYEGDKVYQLGVAFRNGPEKVVVRGDVGRFGYGAGPGKIVVDSMGLSDPLLARLPAERVLRSGHYERYVPDGYLESLATGVNHIADPDLAAYYDRLKSVTQGPLFDAARLHDVLDMNIGKFEPLRQAYIAHRQVAIAEHHERRRREIMSQQAPPPPEREPAPAAPAPNPEHLP